MTTVVEAQVLAKVSAAANGDQSLERFLKAAIAAIDPDDLSRQDADALIGALKRSHALLMAGPFETTRISATPSANAGEPLVLDIVSPDMPFIVDSALAALRAMGGVIRLFAHPVLRVANGAVVDQGGTAVSMLHIQSDPVADTEALVAELEATLRDVAWAVGDWQPMLDRVRKAMGGFGAAPAAQREEAARFVEWLTEHNFTFLGVREYRLENDALLPVPGTGLGILRDDAVKVLRSGPDYVESTPQLAVFAKGNDPLLVTKANVRARVHRRAHMDYVGIKLFADDGRA